MTIDHGSLLYSGSTILGTLLKIEPPKIKNEKVETTSLIDTTRTYISGCLIDIEDFKATFSFEPAVATTLYESVKNGNIAPYKIAFNNGQSWSFSALVTDLQAEGIDSKSPENLMFSATFSPSGSMTIV